MILGNSFCFSELRLRLENENNHSLPHQVVVKFRCDKCERPVETGKSSMNIQSFSAIYVLFVTENYFWLKIFVDSFNKGLLRACCVPDNGFFVENTEEIKEILTLKDYLVCEVGWGAWGAVVGGGEGNRKRRLSIIDAVMWQPNPSLVPKD